MRQMARIIKMGFRIYHEPRQWTRPKLARYFEVDKMTIQRDIHLLREMGIEIVARGKQGYEVVSGFEVFTGDYRNERTHEP